MLANGDLHEILQKKITGLAHINQSTTNFRSITELQVTRTLQFTLICGTHNRGGLAELEFSFSSRLTLSCNTLKQLAEVRIRSQEGSEPYISTHYAQNPIQGVSTAIEALIKEKGYVGNSTRTPAYRNCTVLRLPVANMKLLEPCSARSQTTFPSPLMQK